jgi:hypothetical protein
MALKTLNRKAEALKARAPDDVQTYSFGDCCPGFLPGWEVGQGGNIDPCGGGWQNDLPACHPCYWSAQVPDSTTWFGWLDSCGNISTDWQNLCTVPD